MKVNSSSKQPLVSVVVPTYSRADMLERSLGSIIAQTYKNIEIIVIDDNGLGSESQVNTEKIVNEFSTRTGYRINYFCHEVNQGSAAARNTGIRVSNGEFISFLDDDDEYYPERIENMVPLMEEHADAGLVYAHCIAVKDDGDTMVYQQTFEGNCLFEQAFTGCICATSQWLCRKEALLNCGCFDIVPSKDDSILLYKLLLQGYSIYCVQKVLSIYYEHSGERISNGDKELEGEKLFDKSIYKSLERFSLNQRRLILFAINFRLAKLYGKRRQWMSCIGRFLSSFLFSPIHFSCEMIKLVSRKVRKNELILNK